MERKWARFHRYYSVSNYGEIVNTLTGQLRVPQKRNWYLAVYIEKNWPIHKLVATYFVEGEFEGAVVGHLDSNPYNNRADNLKWCTQKENIADQMKRGTHTSQWSEKSKACRNKPGVPSNIRGRGKSGIKGVQIKEYKTGIRYIVYFLNKYLGSFKTLEEAKEVYNKEHIKRYKISAY